MSDGKKRNCASYARAVEWVALNDNAGDNEGLESVAGYISVVLIADLWNKSAKTVAQDVLNWRAHWARRSND